MHRLILFALLLCFIPAARGNDCCYAPGYVTPSYSYHTAGWWRGRYYPAGYYRWTGFAWHLRDYGLFAGYSPAQVIVLQGSGAIPASGPPVGAPATPQTPPASAPPLVGGAGFTKEETDALKEFLRGLKTPPPMPPADK